MGQGSHRLPCQCSFGSTTDAVASGMPMMPAQHVPDSVQSIDAGLPLTPSIMLSKHCMTHTGANGPPAARCPRLDNQFCFHFSCCWWTGLMSAAAALPQLAAEASRAWQLDASASTGMSVQLPVLRSTSQHLWKTANDLNIYSADRLRQHSFAQQSCGSCRNAATHPL